MEKIDASYIKYRQNLFPNKMETDWNCWTKIFVFQIIYVIY